MSGLSNALYLIGAGGGVVTLVVLKVGWTWIAETLNDHKTLNDRVIDNGTNKGRLGDNGLRIRQSNDSIAHKESAFMALEAQVQYRGHGGCYHIPVESTMMSYIGIQLSGNRYSTTLQGTIVKLWAFRRLI